jgi:hypothetical protein
MSKPFLVVEIVDGALGRIFERSEWSEAVDATVNLVVASVTKETEETIRAEVESYSEWVDGAYHVHIAQAED